MKTKELVSYLDMLLKISAIPGDCSNNGLQIEASDEVKKAVFSVDACQELFDAAVEKDADFIFVHHGLSWGSIPKRFTGMTATRFKTLFKNDISLYAAHLPLDAHPKIGHNALLADMINLQDRNYFAEYSGVDIACGGILPQPKTVEELKAIYDKEINCKANIFGESDKLIRKVGIISGGGGMDGLFACIENDIDCYITGEMEHTMHHIIAESGVSLLQLGHYCSETPGVKAVMDLIENEFKIDCEFIDIPTGL